MNDNNNSRRKFLYNLGLAGLSIPLISSNSTCNDEESKQKSMQKSKEGKLGIALVGLGSYAGGQLAPALQETEHCYLAGIVTGTPSKAETWKKQYNIPDKNIYNYQNFDQIANNPDIDVVYVVLPPSMHKEYVIRGANAGKQVWCEKPMALTASECQEMIDACRKNKQSLAIGYRLHHEPNTKEYTRIINQKLLGKVKSPNFHDDARGWRFGIDFSKTIENANAENIRL